MADLTTRQKAIIALVKNNPNNTLETLSELYGEKIQTGTINALVSAKHITKGEPARVKRQALREVSTYLINAPLNDTIKSDNLIKFYKCLTSEGQTLETINQVNKTTFTSGAINSLIVKGFIKTEKTKVYKTIEKSVNTYC